MERTKQCGTWPLLIKGENQKHSAHYRKIGACAPSTLKPEEREFVVDSGALMHMVNNKDVSDPEMDTLTKSCSPTIVITANKEVQTHEEAIVCQRIGYFLDHESPRKTHQQYYRSEPLR